MRFGTPVDAKGVRSPYRGGVPIVEVVSKSAAANSGFRKGDLLIGLNNAETLTLDNVAFVLRSPEVQEKSNKLLSIRAHLVRDGELLSADVVLDAKPQASTNAEAVD